MKLIKFRILFIIWMVGLVFCALLIKSASLQLFPHKALTQLKEKLFETTVKVTPRRGVIYDRDNEEIAISTSSQSLFADPYQVKKPYYAAKKLSSFLGLNRKKILKQLLNKKRRFIWLKRHLTQKEVQQVKSFQFEGIHFIKESKRFYTKGQSLSQTLGFTDIDGHGLEGIEKKYDKILQGEAKRVLVKRDARGRPLFSNFTPFISRVSGFDVHLTIDSDLQFYFEKQLSKAIKISKAESAMGVILSVEDSEVLAMINLPNYDPNYPNRVKDKNTRRNRVLTDVFEPGSTLKTFTIISAIHAGLKPTKKYSSHKGRLKIGKKIIKEADIKKKFPAFLDMTDILAYSSNIGASLIALEIGSKKLKSTLSKFGFGKKTGIAFQGESSGVLRSLPWEPIEIANIGFGHGISSTALQVANAYASIANGGTLNQPRIIKQIRNPYNGEETIFKTKFIRKVLKEQDAQKIKLMLTSVTEEGGTGAQAVVPGYLVAGKTGTAQKVDFEKGGYKSSEYISSFIGFIPAHKPKYVVYVVIDGAKNNFYASTLAAPIFSKVSSYAVRKAGLSPTLVKEQNFVLSPTQTVKKKIERNLAFADRVPDLKGLTLRQVLRETKDQGLKLKIVGSHRVVKTIPVTGEPIPSNKTITLILN